MDVYVVMDYIAHFLTFEKDKEATLQQKLHDKNPLILPACDAQAVVLALAEALQNAITINMCEFQKAHTVPI